MSDITISLDIYEHIITGPWPDSSSWIHTFEWMTEIHQSFYIRLLTPWIQRTFILWLLFGLLGPFSGLPPYRE